MNVNFISIQSSDNTVSICWTSHLNNCWTCWRRASCPGQALQKSSFYFLLWTRELFEFYNERNWTWAQKAVPVWLEYSRLYFESLRFTDEYAFWDVYLWKVGWMSIFQVGKGWIYFFTIQNKLKNAQQTHFHLIYISQVSACPVKKLKTDEFDFCKLKKVWK